MKKSRGVMNALKSFKPTVDDVKRKFPISLWLPNYNLRKLQGDIIAGLTVGIMVVPQSLAFATFAGLPPHYGLYTAFPPGIMYLLLGSAKDMNVGPTVITSLLTRRYNDSLNPHGAAALAFFTGLVLFILGLFRLGFIVKFIPTSVVSGFVSAAAFTIAVGQLKGMFGHSNAPRTFYGRLAHFFKNLPNTNPWDAGIGLTCLVILVALQFYGKKKLKKPEGEKVPKYKYALYKIMWFICVARSALICIFATLVVFGLYRSGHTGMTLPGKLPSGLPSIDFPLKHITNLRTNSTMHTMDLVKGMGAGLAIVPMILFIEDVSIAKALGRKNKYTVDATQELYAVGIGNMFGALFGGYPVTGSFSRSAVNSMSGAATTFAGVITSSIVILALCFLTPVFFYIPMAALSAMVMAAVVNMIELSVPRRIWKINKIDLIPYVISFFGTFYELEAGVLGGSAVALIIMLYREVKPRKTVNNSVLSAVGTVKVQGGIWYPGTESLVNTFNEMVKNNKQLKVILLDLENVYEFDYTVIIGLKVAASDLAIQDVELKFVNVRTKKVRRVVHKAGLAHMIETELTGGQDLAAIEEGPGDESDGEIDDTNDLQDEEERLTAACESNL